MLPWWAIHWGLWLHWLALVFAVSGSLMISRIRIPKL